MARPSSSAPLQVWSAKTMSIPVAVALISLAVFCIKVAGAMTNVLILPKGTLLTFSNLTGQVEFFDKDGIVLKLTNGGYSRRIKPTEFSEDQIRSLLAYRTLYE